MADNKIPEDFLITKDTAIEELLEYYPEVVDYLVKEYDFYCANCIMSEFETLETGAAAHGIIDEDFEEMLGEVNAILSS